MDCHKETTSETDQDDEDAKYADRMAREHAQDDGNLTSPLASASPSADDPRLVTASEVSFAQYGGYLAQPTVALSSDKVLPCLVVIHEWWGLNPQIKSVARQLALEGYKVLAVNLYGKPATAEIKTARQNMKECLKVKDEYCMKCLKAAVKYLQGGATTTIKIGVIGWCLGGMFSLLLALAMPLEIHACAIYYGKLETDAGTLQPLRAPVLGVFGAADRGIPIESVRAFESALESLGKKHEIHIYPGVDHAFCNPTGNNYQEKEAEDAWNKTLEFFSQSLKE